MIDGDRIVAIATTNTMNRKTGHVTQLWILPANISPVKALSTNQDRSVCGDCKLRGSTCYVNIAQAPQSVYKAWLRGTYPIVEPDVFYDRKVRFGAYGDPIALPVTLVQAIVTSSRSWLGYTHSWKMPHAAAYKRWLMASVDTPEERAEAKAMGWRTFRVKTEEQEIECGETVCPASEEAGKKISCEYCLLCSGLDGKGKNDVVINIHGHKNKKVSFSKLHQRETTSGRISLI